MIGYYNDFIWPLMVIETNSKQVMTVAIRVFQAATGTIDIGSMVAGFVIATLPLLLMFVCGSRLYIEGDVYKRQGWSRRRRRVAGCC